MAANPTQKASWHSDYLTGSLATDRLGHPGKYYGGTSVAAGTSLELTGSNYGYGAVMLSVGAVVAGTKIQVGGAEIAGDDLKYGVIYDLSPEKVTAVTDIVYLFKRQQ